MVRGKQTWNWNQSLAWPNRNDRFPGYTNITAVTNGADSRYDSLQIQFRKELTHGLLLHAHYVWSKALTNAVDEGSANSIWVHDPSMQWGRSPWDRTHAFTLDFVYTLPVGKGNRWSFMNPVLDRIVGGWQFSGILRLRSGTPLTITSSLARAALSVQGAVPADRLAEGRLDRPTRGLWFDPSAFATPPSHRPGNAGYGIFDGPGVVIEDLGLYKTVRIREGSKMQFRIEAYNALNHVNLSNPFTDVDNRSFLGKISSAGPALRLQAAVRIDF